MVTKKEKPKLIGELTEEELKGLKEKYGKIAVVANEDGYVGYFRRPKRNEVNSALVESANAADKPLVFAEQIAIMCFVGGSKAIYEDDWNFLGIADQMRKLADGSQAYVVKL